VIETYIVTEVRTYRDALALALGRTGRIQVVGSAAYPADAVCELAAVHPDVVLLDLVGADGPDWAREIGAASPQVRMIVLGLQEAEHDVIAWAEAGVSGYVGREACLEDLVAAIEAVARGEAPCPARATAMLLRRIAAGPHAAMAAWERGRLLTLREREIVRLVGQGLSNQQIAKGLYIALPTVKNHVHNILEKLGVHRRSDAVQAVRQAGFVSRAESVVDTERAPLLTLVQR
jgi:two-component system nitrate/nitrite response regulator NarL